MTIKIIEQRRRYCIDAGENEGFSAAVAVAFARAVRQTAGAEDANRRTRALVSRPSAGGDDSRRDGLGRA